MLRLKIMQCTPGKDRATTNLRVFVISISLFPSLLSIPSYDMDQWGQYLQIKGIKNGITRGWRSLDLLRDRSRAGGEPGLLVREEEHKKENKPPNELTVLKIGM